MIELLDMKNPEVAPIWKFMNSKYRPKVRQSALLCFEKLS